MSNIEGISYMVVEYAKSSMDQFDAKQNDVEKLSIDLQKITIQFGSVLNDVPQLSEQRQRL